MKFLILLLLSTSSFAHWCELNIAPLDLVVPEDKKKDFVVNFEMDFEKIGNGKRQKISNVESLTWSKGNYAFLKLLDVKNKIEVYGQFSQTQDEISLNLSPSYQLKCLKKAPEGQTTQVKSAELTDETALDKLPLGLFLTLKKELFLYYVESNSGKRMEGLYWQGGKKTSKLNLNLEQDWCLFQFQIKVDEDIVLPEGLKAPVITSQFANNVLSLSLVDFEQAKIKTQNGRYALFQMECRLKDNSATFKHWKDIVGSSWEIKK